jgi:anti-sigma factor RsiW
MTPCPVPFETLVALWTGDLGEPDSEQVEQHLFACDTCAAASEQLGKLVAGLRQLIPPVISHAHRDRLKSAGMRIRHTPVDAGVQAEAHFAADVDLLVHVLKGDLGAAERVDVELVDPQGVPRVHLAHVPFDAKAGEVLIACQRHYQHDGALTGDPVFRVNVYEGGVRRQVGSYFVKHHWA